MATTTNFGWETPDDTDLVKDGAAAIRTSLNGVDSSFVDLKGGTTGQVLSKASGTDLDFTWVAQDDSNAIQNAIVDAKGDLIAATAADTPARLAVGTNGQVLTADSAEATGLKWAPASGGGLIKLAAATFSNVASFNPGSYFNSTYKRYKLIVTAYSSVNNADLWVKFRYSSNSTSLSANYYSSYTGRAYTTAAIFGDVSNGSNGMAVGRMSSDSNEVGVWELTFTNIGQGSNSSPGCAFYGLQRASGGGIAGAGYAATTAQSWDGIEVIGGSGNFYGSYALYGLEN